MAAEGRMSLGSELSGSCRVARFSPDSYSNHLNSTERGDTR